MFSSLEMVMSDEIRLCCPPLSGRECRKCRHVLRNLGREVTITRNVNDLPMTAAARRGRAVYLIEGNYGDWRLIPWTAAALTAAASLPRYPVSTDGRLYDKADKAQILAEVDAVLAEPNPAATKREQRKPARPAYRILEIS